jgi:hypothetical protein
MTRFRLYIAIKPRIADFELTQHGLQEIKAPFEPGRKKSHEQSCRKATIFVSRAFCVRHEFCVFGGRPTCAVRGLPYVTPSSLTFEEGQNEGLVLLGDFFSEIGNDARQLGRRDKPTKDVLPVPGAINVDLTRCFYLIRLQASAPFDFFQFRFST